MNRSSTIRLGVAGTVAAAGLVIGGIGLASAADDDQPSDTSSSTASDGSTGSATADDQRGPGRHGRGARGARGGPGSGPGDLSSLAEALDVNEADLRSAFQAARAALTPDTDQRRDSDRSTPPTETEREQRQEQFVTTLAAELDGVSAAQITAAMDEAQTAHRADRRAELGDRLSEAVAADDLTAEDRSSVLKAFDAGVLRGGR